MPAGFAAGFGLGSIFNKSGGHVLTDSEIWDEFAYTDFDISPLTVEQVQPASVDLRLGSDFKRLRKDKRVTPTQFICPEEIVVDTREDASQPMDHVEADSIIIQPGECVLGTTMETVYLPPHLLGEVAGRSSMGRVFVEVHQTAGIIDPGYVGEITLELVNNNPRPVKLYKGQRVCQMVLYKLNKPAENPYGAKTDSKYQGQVGATPSAIDSDLS